MTLTWHDVTAPLLALAAGALVWADAAGSPAPGLGGTRVLGAAVLGLGMASCAVGGGAPGTAKGYQSFVGILGGLAFVLGIVTIATGSAGMLQSLAGLVVGIAVISTVRRVVQPLCEKPAVTQPRDDRELVGGRR
ncbi:MAG TPA: hypothetical protein VNQ77_05220 [Frankiaceae bacterium]|nr:hypothetical protein [Frankiaceae bacterium]